MKRWRFWARAVALWLAVAVAAPAFAADVRYTARARLDPAGPVMPGQPVKLVVDALTTTWFTAAPVFPTIDVPGAIASPPGDDATNLNEDIGGVRWFGVSRTYIVTPQAGGELAIAPIVLVLHVGQVDKPVQAKTPALKLAVKVVERPPGAENALATSRLQLVQKLDRALAGLKQGDAFTRTLTVSADGVQGMLLPPAAFPPVDGLAVYPKAPIVQDLRKEKEGFLGSTRTDAATYVLQRAGHYELPGVRIAWWDTKADQLRTAEVAPLAFDVAANPAYTPEIGIPAEASQAAPARVTHLDLHRIAAVAAAVALLALVAWLLLPRLRRAWRAGVARARARRRRWRDSEARMYALALRATRGDGTGVAPALYRWLDRLPPSGVPATLGDRLPGGGDDDLQRWMAHRYGGAGAAPAAPAVRRALTRLREAIRRGAGTRDQTPGSLVPLNPGTGRSRSPASR
jgi:hypothetical protein